METGARIGSASPSDPLWFGNAEKQEAIGWRDLVAMGSICSQRHPTCTHTPKEGVGRTPGAPSPSYPAPETQLQPAD